MPRMFAASTSSNDFSTDTPPRCTMASQPRTRSAVAFLSARSQGTTSSCARASSIGALSETRIARTCGFRLSRSTLPKAPAAPVSNSFSIVISRQLSYDIENDYHEAMAKVSIAKAQGNPEVATIDVPRKRLRNLAHELVEGIGARIRDRTLKPGDKLPTEAEIMREWGVSRTVVREALSKLQAAGLVETRHGIGTFVLEPPAASGFRIDPAEIETAVDVLAVLELRISLESESAGLAAQRRTDEQLAEMRRALDELIHAEPGVSDTVSPDFRFHHLIAVATG